MLRQIPSFVTIAGCDVVFANGIDLTRLVQVERDSFGMYSVSGSAFVWLMERFIKRRSRIMRVLDRLLSGHGALHAVPGAHTSPPLRQAGVGPDSELYSIVSQGIHDRIVSSSDENELKKFVGARTHELVRSHQRAVDHVFDTGSGDAFPERHGGMASIMDDLYTLYPVLNSKLGSRLTIMMCNDCVSGGDSTHRIEQYLRNEGPVRFLCSDAQCIHWVPPEIAGARVPGPSSSSCMHESQVYVSRIFTVSPSISRTLLEVKGKYLSKSVTGRRLTLFAVQPAVDEGVARAMSVPFGRQLWKYATHEALDGGLSRSDVLKIVRSDVYLRLYGKHKRSHGYLAPDRLSLTGGVRRTTQEYVPWTFASGSASAQKKTKDGASHTRGVPRGCMVEDAVTHHRPLCLCVHRPIVLSAIPSGARCV